MARRSERERDDERRANEWVSGVTFPATGRLWRLEETGRADFSDERAALLRDSVNERAFSEKGLTNCSKFGAERPRGENERTNERVIRETERDSLESKMLPANVLRSLRDSFGSMPILRKWRKKIFTK